MGLIPGNTGVATTFPDGFLVGNGSVTAPTFRFQDTGTGFYRKAADSLGIAAAGVEVGSFTSAGAWTMGPANTSNLQVLNGTAAIDGGTAVSSILEWRSTVNAASRRYQWRQDIDAYGDFGLLGGGASNTATPNVKFIYATAAGALTFTNVGTSGTYRPILTLNTAESANGTGGHINFSQAGTIVGRIGSVYQSGGVIGLSFDTFSTSLVNAATVAGSGAWTLGPSGATDALVNTCRGRWQSSGDGSHNLGSASLRWGTLFAAAGTINTSDARLKQNIQPLASVLEKVLLLKPSTWVAKYSSYQVGTQGFIAQELEQVFPSLVQTQPETIEGHENIKTVSASGPEMIAILVKAIQELNAKIAALQGTPQ